MELRVLLNEKVVFVSYIKVKAVLGRREGCDIKLSHPEVSSRHAEIYEKGGRWFVRDLGSVNGTFVNGVRVDKCEIKEGDRIIIYPYHILLMEERTAFEDVKTVISRRKEVLIVDEEGPRVLTLPYERDGIALKEEDGEVYIIERESGRKKKVDECVVLKRNGKEIRIYSPSSISLPSMGRWKAIFMISGFLVGFVIFFRGSEKWIDVRVNHEESVNLSNSRVSDEIEKMLKSRDWKGLRIKIMEMMAEGKMVDGMDALLKMSYKEEEMSELIVKARVLIKKKEFSRANRILARIPEESVYYRDAEQLRERIRLMNRKRKKNHIPSYLDFYLKGELVKAMKETRNIKLQIAISNVASLIEDAGRSFNEGDFEKTVILCDKASEMDLMITGERTGYVRKKLSALKISAIYRLSKESFEKGDYNKAVEYLEKGLKSYPHNRGLNRLRKRFIDACKDFYKRAYSISEVSTHQAISFLTKANLLCIYDRVTEHKVKKLLLEIKGK